MIERVEREVAAPGGGHRLVRVAVRGAEAAADVLEAGAAEWVGEPERLLKATCLVRRPDQAPAVRSALRRAFPGPAVEVVALAPLDTDADLVLLAWLADSASVQVSHPAAGVSIARHPGFELAVVGEAAGEEFAGCFAGVDRALAAAGQGYANVLKSWSYFGLLGDSPDARFEAFNQARRRFFAGVEFTRCRASWEGPAYPANTGIGTSEPRPALSGIAARAGAGCELVALDNPLQTSPANYPRERGHTAPLFSRATAIVSGDAVLVLVSGTVSVRGAETRHLGSAVGQAGEIARLLDSLLSVENLARAGVPVVEGGIGSLFQVTVYVDRPGDYAAVRGALEPLLPAPALTTYAQADLSRGDLLVEMEGMALLRRT